ncbi:DUF421 domain-containing protein [Anaeroselena agilis]|uniref:DUF421 domain-containing protein n=1 Tax=Anaeroselena agilis TaxID=3063788 RepID=A0ABU3NUH3_9FIRM|nr:DUF421 domain-containing protein [Selenomonadales bacterium 4137-cl]
MDDFLSYTVRVILIFAFTYFAGRILPKKAIAQMTAYEFTGVMLFTTVAAEPLVTKVTVKAVYGLGLIITLMLLAARLSLCNKLVRIMEHQPSVIINNGQIDARAMKETSMSMNQLMGLLRQKGYDNVQNIAAAVIEPQGNLSVIPKAGFRPVQPDDLNLTPQPAGMCLPLIMDGQIIQPNLKYSDLTEDWLVQQLARQGVVDFKSLPLVQLDPSGKVLVIRSDAVERQ